MENIKMNKISKKDLEVAKKDPGVVAVLNFLLPGLGFIYSEELFLAIITMFIWVFVMFMVIHEIMDSKLTGAIMILIFYIGLLNISIAETREKNKKKDEQ